LRRLNLGTIARARAIGMEALIGSLEEGKLADVLVYDMLSPGMVGAAQVDAGAAVVMHSCARDVDMVIVDGIVRKEEGNLVVMTVSGERSADVGYVGPGPMLRGGRGEGGRRGCM
jgi:cytosine/adenosine deaminase-related metal-dependent hydrolase